MNDGRRELTIRAFGRTGLLRLPDKRSTSAIATGLLLVGVLMGVAIGPVAANSLGGLAQQIIVVMAGPGKALQPATPAPSSATAGTGSSSNGSGPPASSGSPTSSPAASANSAAGDAGSGTGGGTTTPTTTTSRTTSAPPPPPKLNLHGVVIELDANSQAFVLVDRKHRLFEVHPDTRTATPPATPKVGQTIGLTTLKLANGTLAATQLVVTKQQKAPANVDVEGVVSFVDPAHNRYAVSARGVSLLITPPAPHAARQRAAAESAVPPSSLLEALLGALLGGGATTPIPRTVTRLPTIGHRLEVTFKLPALRTTPTTTTTATTTTTTTTATTTIGHSLPPTPPFQALKQTDHGAATPPLDLAGFTSAVDPAERTVTMSADGPGLSGASVVLHVPSTIDVTKLFPQLALVVHAIVAADGTYTMTGADLDSGVSAAEDPTARLGDFLPKHARRRLASADRLPGGKRVPRAL